MQLAYFASPLEKEDDALRVAGNRDKWKVLGKPVLAFAHSGYDRAYTDIIAQALSKGLTHSSKIPTGPVGFFGFYNWDAILVTEDEAFHWTVWQPINDSVNYELVNILRPLEGKLALGEYASLGNAIFSIGKGAPTTADTIRKHLNCPRVEQTVWRRSDKLQYGELREELGELSELAKALAAADFGAEESKKQFLDLEITAADVLATWRERMEEETTLIDKAVTKSESNLFGMLELLSARLAKTPSSLEDCYQMLGDCHELVHTYIKQSKKDDVFDKASVEVGLTDHIAELVGLLSAFEDYDDLLGGLTVYHKVGAFVNTMITNSFNGVYSKTPAKEKA
ncbi:hypothetical protein COLO4_01410 [Corchorus olitorius]|uniref:Uncharacterized protein n=1 Tax=Corchorus olitorius TaxID=93759 RepID=A0A1R3L2P0_9ROSI|nr:hypothetical protein COLO4_01410 [Corchorus olitorius]